MNTNVIGILNRGYLDPLFFGALGAIGAIGGAVVGNFFGRPVEGCLAGVSLSYGLSEYSSRSSGNDGNSDRRSQSMVRTVDHHTLDSDSEELTDSGQCARSLPLDSDSEELTDSGQCARSLPLDSDSEELTDSGQCARSLPCVRRDRLQGGYLVPAEKQREHGLYTAE